MTVCTRFWVRWFSMAFAVLCLAALLVSCSDSTCPKVSDDTDCPDRPFPEDLLNFFANAYEQKDIDRYGVVLSQYYEFEFVPEVADSLSLPQDSPWWGRLQDLESTENMFDDPEVGGIEMQLGPPCAGWEWLECSHPFITDGLAEPETTWIDGLCARFEPDIRVHIEKPGEVILTLWVHNSYLDIMVTPDPDCPGDWVILRIKETIKAWVSMAQEDPRASRRSALASATEPFTWSGIKAMFK